MTSSTITPENSGIEFASKLFNDLADEIKTECEYTSINMSASPRGVGDQFVIHPGNVGMFNDGCHISIRQRVVEMTMCRIFISIFHGHPRFNEYETDPVEEGYEDQVISEYEDNNDRMVYCTDVLLEDVMTTLRNFGEDKFNGFVKQ